LLALFAFSMPVILLFCGLVLDIGTMQLRKEQVQSAADAAALGAEMEGERGTGNWVAAGKGDAAINGFADGVNGATVTVQAAASAGPYAGNPSAIQVTITQQVQTSFMGILNGGTTTLSAQAVALLPPCSFYTGASAYGLLQAPFWMQSTTFSSNCPQDINKGMSVDALSTVTAFAEDVAGSAGLYPLAGLLSVLPHFNAPPVSDPLASVTSPSYSGVCSYVAYTAAVVTATLNPGTYCGGITLVGSTVTMNPGLYVVTGGMHWTGATVQGTGVTLFMTHGGIFGYGQVVIGGNSNVKISAPVDASAGGVPTIAMFGDRNWTATSAWDFQCIGSTIRGDGIWYMTGTGLSSAGCSISGPNYFGVVTDSLEGSLFSTVTISGNYSNVPGGSPFRSLGGMVQ
jgi:hypothetical protein